jgi:hypothetical protein
VLLPRDETSRPAAPPAEVGRIEDSTYQRIGELLFAPATLHASGFMERYDDAIREFHERQRAPEVPGPTPPQPTDEEMASYNAALHAWLDGDRQRISALGTHENGDSAGPDVRHFAAGAGMERLLGVADEAFARPGLPALKTLQPQPGLREGVSNLSG